MSILNFIKRIINRALISIDQIHWWLQCAPFRKVSYTTALKKVLLCNVMTMVSNSKVEAILAAALRKQGYQPIILLAGRNQAIESIFNAIGINQFVFLDQLTTPDEKNVGFKDAEKLLQKYSNFNDLTTLEIDGFRIGRNAQSRLLRKLRIGKLNTDNIEHWEEMKTALAESLTCKLVASKLIQQINPDLALFVEKGYTPAGEFFDACINNEIDTVQWLGAPESNYLLFKRYNRSNRAVHPLALSNETWQNLLNSPWETKTEKQLLQKLQSHYSTGAWFNRQQLQTGKEIVQKEEFFSTLGLDPEKKTAVIFAHILYDATFFYGDNLFSDYEEWLIETVREAIKNPMLNWVIKVHPVNVWRSKMDKAEMVHLEELSLQKAFGTLPKHVKIMRADTYINTFSLFASIDYAITVRGTIGMELPCFGIPVILAGTGRYAGRGFSLDPSTVEDYRSLLGRLHELQALDKATVTLARKYAYGTFFLRPFQISSFVYDYHANTFGLDALIYNVRLIKSKSRNTLFGTDVNSIIDWLISSENEDLLNTSHDYHEKS